MRQGLLAVLALACFLFSTGCVAVSAKNNRFASGSELVSHDGQVYLVDKCCGKVWKVDTSAAEAWKPGAQCGCGDACCAAKK